MVLLGFLRTICTGLELIPNNECNISTTLHLDVMDWLESRYSPPFTVSEVTLSRVQGWEVIGVDRTVSLHVSSTTYNIVLSAPRLAKFFVVYKSEDRGEATLTFNNIRHRLHLLASASDILDKEVVQKLFNAVDLHPTFECAHVACFLGLSDLLSNANVAMSINETAGLTGKTPLHIAVEQEKLNCVQRLLTLNAKLDLADSKGDTPLHLAARHQKLNILEEIASEGKLFINKTNQAGETALHGACLEGFHENVEILLNYGANPSLTKSNRLPIHCAVIKGSTRCVESLIKMDANLIDAKETSTGNSHFHLTKSKEMMHYLIKIGCPIDQRNNKNQTPLLLRIQEDDFSSAFGLLVAGADASAVDGNGMTALHLAIKQDKLELVQMLIVFGADVNECNGSGVSPFHEAALSTGKNRNEILYCLKLVGAKTCSQQKRWIKFCNVCDNINVTKKAKGPTNVTESVLDGLYVKSALDAALSRSESLYGTEGSERLNPGYRVLCLDGGGIRSLVTIKILMAIENITGRPIRDSFDWIGGTSTGAILAMGLLQGRTLNELMGAYFRLKDEVFQGTKPCNSESLENFLKKEFGENTKMTDVQKPRVMLTATLDNRAPQQPLILRNYHMPVIEHNSSAHLPNVPRPLRPGEQLVWQALRATSAAPTYFRANGKFIDGGLIANNPTLDVLSEINKFNIANKAAKNSEVDPLHVLISIGTGKSPLKPVGYCDSTVTIHAQGTIDFPGNRAEFKAAKNLKDLLVDQTIQSEGQTVSRAAAWCNMIDVPYYRLNPQLSEDVPLDCTDDSKLVSLLWETECYLQKNEEKLIQLANLLN